MCVFRKALRHSVQPHLIYATVTPVDDYGDPALREWTIKRFPLADRGPSFFTCQTSWQGPEEGEIAAWLLS